MADRRTLKVWTAVSIEIDLDALEAEYGITGVKEARADVKASVVGVLQQALYAEQSGVVIDVKESK